MANTKKVNSANGKPKKVAPIKVEKIVDTPSSSRKEVCAIIVGILVVAALVIGSVVYFRGDNEPLTEKNDKKDNVVDVEDDILDLLEDEKEEDKKEKVNYIEKLNNTVKKECTTCTVVTLEAYTATVNKEHEDYTEDMEDRVVVGSKNKTETKVYYTDEKNTYQIVVKGEVSATQEEIENMVMLTISNAANKVMEDKELTDEQKEEFVSTTPLKDIEDAQKDQGTIVVTSKDTYFATHGITIRIEEKDEIDWSKGVTVNGTTYNESVLNEDKEDLYTMQDEKGINIIIGVTEDDLGKDPKNAPIEFDVKYTTGKGEEKENKYEVDLTEVVIKAEDEEDYENPEEAATEEWLEDVKTETEEMVASLEEAVDTYVEANTETEEQPTEPEVTEPETVETVEA